MATREAIEKLRALLQKPPSVFEVVCLGITIGTATEWYPDCDDQEVLVIYRGFLPHFPLLISGTVALDYEQGWIYPLNESGDTYEIDEGGGITILEALSLTMGG